MLKRIIHTWIFLLAVVSGHTQSLQLYEYWVDSDYSKHTTVRGSATDISFQMDVSQISKGVHYLNFRAQNSDNDWGTISRYLFYVPEENQANATLTHYQYWIDNDYSGQNTKSTNMGDISQSIDISSLTAGVHYFNFRARNSEGVWGNLSRYLFYVPEPTNADATLTHYQYWIDNDFGGQVTTATNNGDISLPLDISTLTTGVHYFNFRARNSEGVWGNLSRYLFYVPEPTNADATLTHYQYWIDSDFGGQVTTATNNGDISLPIDISTLTTGVHYFNFRARNSEGVWGNLSRYLFYVPEMGGTASTLAKAQYWIDDDYAANVTQKATGDFFTSIDVSQLKSGVHYFNFRAQNSDGIWGNLSRYLFYIPEGSIAENNPIVGFRYNFNSKYTYVPLSDRMEYEMSNYLIDIPELAEMGSLEEGCTYSFDAGSHTVHFSRTAQVSFAIQFKNKADEWSAPVASQFEMQDAFDKPMAELQVQRQVELEKVPAGDFQAFYMNIEENRNYFLKSSQPCKIRLYESNGALLTTIQPEALLNTYQIGLTKGTYYGIVYNTIKDETHAADVFTLKLMLTDNIVPTPVISYEQEMVTMSCEEPTATIYYTLDGTDPTKESTRYSGPFALRHNAVVKAVAMAKDMADSDIATLKVNSYKVVTPTIEFTNLKLYMDCQTEGAAVFYTLDGSDPTMNGQRYTEPVTITNSCTAKAVGKRNGYNNSDIAVLEVDVSNVKTSTPQIEREGNGLRITCRTEGATIHLTTDGTTPSGSSPTISEGFYQPQFNGTVKVIAMKDGELPSDVASFEVDWLKVAQPVLTLDRETGILTMSTSTLNAIIYYTLDGTDPTRESTRYEKPLEYDRNGLIKAFAVLDGWYDSEIATLTVDSYQVQAPIIEFTNLHLYMECATNGAEIFYTLDGSDPTVNGQRYTEPIAITQNCKATAVGKRDGYRDSEMVVLEVDVSNVTTAKPQIEREGDGLRITCRTQGATLHYTTDGTTPSSSSPTLSEGFYQPQFNGTVKVIALKDGELPSDVASIEVDWLHVAMPVLSYDVESSLLTMTCATPDATIYYIIGEGSPSVEYTSPIVLNDNRTVTAIARANGLLDSEVATYTPNSFTCEAVTFSFDGHELLLSCATEGAVVHYTTDGAEPGSDSPLFLGKITIKEILTVKAIAMKPNTNSSTLATYTIPAYYDGIQAEVGTSGQLSQAFGWCNTEEIEQLVVKGTLNETDIAILRNMSQLKHLDMGDVKMLGSRLPDKCFEGMPLVSIIIPESLTGAGNNLFDGCQQLAAITWKPNIKLTELMLQGVDNPNLLVYVKLLSDAPTTVSNVVVNDYATDITLVDRKEGNNNFYCPTPFKAGHISYQHSYQQQTVVGQCRGWETLALPFDVETIMHKSQGQLAPFAKGDAESKPFWLCRLEIGGFERVDHIEANTPYIISMPNNQSYADQYILGGQVTFEAKNVQVHSSADVVTVEKGGFVFVPCFTLKTKDESVLPLNVMQEFEGYPEGSNFFRNLQRDVRPFECYIQSTTGNARRFSIEEETTGIEELCIDNSGRFKVYNTSGQCVLIINNLDELQKGCRLRTGIYFVNGKKIMLK